jgi:hypothetical protein
LVKKYIIQGYQCGGVGLADTLKQMKIYSIYLVDTLGQVSPIVFFGYKKAKSRCPKWGHPPSPPKKKSVHVVGGGVGKRGVYLYASA